MKFAIFFLFCCVALAAAAPQVLTYPGYVGPALTPFGASTLVAGPTVVNGAVPGYAGRLLAPGYFGAGWL